MDTLDRSVKIDHPAKAFVKVDPSPILDVGLILVAWLHLDAFEVEAVTISERVKTIPTTAFVPTRRMEQIPFSARMGTMTFPSQAQSPHPFQNQTIPRMRAMILHPRPVAVVLPVLKKYGIETPMAIPAEEESVLSEIPMPLHWQMLGS